MFGTTVEKIERKRFGLLISIDRFPVKSTARESVCSLTVHPRKTFKITNFIFDPDRRTLKPHEDGGLKDSVEWKTAHVYNTSFTNVIITVASDFDLEYE